ncbi:hypothetical protein FACS189411_10220 [Bacteroidia bacterium]|nr:hypothetical protein FACS189411_10220 [Bacteroidia bacterium]
MMIAILYLCGTWYITLLYLVLSLLGIELIRLSNRIKPWYPCWITSHWKQTKLTVFFAVIIGVSCLMHHAYNVVAHPVVTHVNIDLPKGEGNKHDSLTVVMISDAHIGEIIGKELVQHYVELSNAQHPDMVVFVGDLLDYDLRVAEREHIEDDLLQLKAPLGVYAVNGNHEYRANRFSKRKWIQKISTLLIDSTVLIDNSFYLVGRDDYINRARKSLRALVREVDKSKPVILLDHQPWTFFEAAMNDVDLGLYGHTHYGQIWPYPLAMKLVYECAYGSYKKGNTQFYVSSGIGIAGPPYRVGTVSELVVLHIRFI